MALNRLGDYIELVDVRNEDGRFGPSDVRGISTAKQFIPTKANLDGVNLSSYKVVDGGQFAYVADTSRRGEKIALAFSDEEPCIISSIYTVFRVKDESKLLPRYLMMFFNRPEFDRYARFNSWGSARETFDWDVLTTTMIPVPDIVIQKAIADVSENIVKRQKALDSIRDMVQSSCQILVREATEEANSI